MPSKRMCFFSLPVSRTQQRLLGSSPGRTRPRRGRVVFIVFLFPFSFLLFISFFCQVLVFRSLCFALFLPVFYFVRGCVGLRCVVLCCVVFRCCFMFALCFVAVSFCVEFCSYFLCLFIRCLVFLFVVVSAFVLFSLSFVGLVLFLFYGLFCFVLYYGLFCFYFGVFFVSILWLLGFCRTMGRPRPVVAFQQPVRTEWLFSLLYVLVAVAGCEPLSC